MPFLYYVNVTLHVLGAMLWLGGMLIIRRGSCAEQRHHVDK